MSYLDRMEDISQLGQRKLVVVWGKSNTGKTEFGSTWPKPMCYLQVGDDGSNTIQAKKGIKGQRMQTVDALQKTLQELIKAKGAGYNTVFIDTFSMLTNIWVDEFVVQKKKRMTQQLWGDLKTTTEEIIRSAHKLALYTWVILSCHEAVDTIDGLEDELLPDARPSVSKGARTYLEGMANFGFHTTRIKRDITDAEGNEKSEVRYACHIGANPYYWTKLQTAKDTNVPELLINPTYKKLVKSGIISEN